MKVLAVVLGVLLFFAGVGVISNNNIVGDRNNAQAKFSDIQADEQRRGDLIPNLMETVKGFAKQESSVLLGVTEARAKVGQLTVNVDSAKLSDPAYMKQLSEAQATLAGALKSLMVVVERYPDIKSGANFLALQSQLEGTENRIAVSRKYYNESVRSYNTRIEKAPGSIVSSFMGHKRMELFQAAPASRVVPNVKF